MNTLLIVPPSPYIGKNNMPPLGLLSISSVLENAGFKTEIIDCNVMEYDLKTLKKILEEKKPDMIGITGTTYTRFDAVDVAILSKNTCPGALVGVGGPHFSFVADETLCNIPEIDVVVRGEGEYTMLELAQNIEKNIGFEDVLGISFRQNNKIVHNNKRPHIKNLDDIPFSDRKNPPLEKYNQMMEFLNVPCTNVICGRGCPNKCVFCSSSSMWGCHTRVRSAKNICDEIEYLLNEYGLKSIYFVDDTLTFSKKRILGLCNEIKNRKLNFSWFTNIRVDTVNKEILKEMKMAGCFYVAFGVESGSPDVLKALNKNITLDAVMECAINCKDLGIRTKAYFTFSNPSETEKDIDLTFDLMDKLSRYVDIIAPSVLSIFPGTYLEKRAVEIGCLPINFSWNAPFYVKEYEAIGTFSNTPIYIENMDINALIRIRARVLFEDIVKNEKISNLTIIKKGICGLLKVKNFSELKVLKLAILYYVKSLIHNIRRWLCSK